MPVTTVSRRSAEAGRATKDASSPNSAPAPGPEGKRRTPVLRHTGSNGGGGGRSPGSESRSACVEASTSGFLRCRISTMAAVAAATVMGARRKEHKTTKGDHLTEVLNKQTIGEGEEAQLHRQFRVQTSVFFRFFGKKEKTTSEDMRYYRWITVLDVISKD